jgi:hypothetical protein
MDRQRQLCFQTISLMAQNVPRVSAFPYSHHKANAYIFMPVPNDGFVEKPKHVARLGNKRYCLKIYLSLTGHLYLSIHASQRDSSPVHSVNMAKFRTEK